jgi:hypothetical protein
MAKHSVIVRLSGPWKTWADKEFEFPIVEFQNKYSFVVYWYAEHPQFTYSQGYAFCMERKSKKICYFGLGLDVPRHVRFIAWVPKIINIRKYFNRKLTKQLAMITLMLYIMAGDYSAKM